MSELPPDVRDRAARAAMADYLSRPDSDMDDWRSVVDAVAEVLAAEQPQRECSCTGFPDYEGPCPWCDVHGQPSVAWDQGRAEGRHNERVLANMELDAAKTTITVECDQHKARVNQLEAALSGLIHYIQARSGIPMSTQLRAVLIDAVAVLSAALVENETS